MIYEYIPLSVTYSTLQALYPGAIIGAAVVSHDWQTELMWVVATPPADDERAARAQATGEGEEKLDQHA